MFDLDGTLFDTNKANYLSYKEACNGFCDVSEDFFYEHCMILSISLDTFSTQNAK